MLEGLPVYLSVLFGLTVLLTIGWFYAATRSKGFLLFIVLWTILQSVLGVKGVFQDTEALPPKLMLFGVFPSLLIILFMFLTRTGKNLIDRTHLKPLTYFHTIRLPVEIILALLFHQGFMSRYITFEGTNFDIFSGVTAFIVAYLVFRSVTVRSGLLLGWNILCLLLLLNVVITAIFAIPSPIQKLAFDQPNVAVLYFPFNLLPSVVVPLVFFAHLIAIRQITRHKIQA